jgi:hypothetical protein
MSSSDADQLRRHSLWLSRLTLFLFLATFAVTVGLQLLGLIVAAFRGSAPPPAMAWGAVLWVPVPCYLYALWAIRGVFLDFARGGTLGPAMAAGCIRAGWALAIGATLSAVGVPNLARLLGARSSYLVFDVAYLAVGVVGLALILLGRLLARAAEAQREAAALREELGGFF